MKFIPVIVLSIIIIVLSLRLLIYRRQVNNLSRHVAFMNEKGTHATLTSDLQPRELVNLMKEIDKLSENSRKSKTEMKKREQLIRETITGLSHDIRTPLTSLNGYFDLLMQEDTTLEAKEKYAAIIKHRISSLEGILEELFTYAKVSNEEYTYQIERLDMNELVSEVCFSFYDVFKEAGYEPKVSFVEEPLMVDANAEAITRIVQNVVKNALAHGEGYIKLSLEKDENNAVFRCANRTSEDNIDLSMLFNRFYKASNSRKSAGTGLGLAISKELSEKTGGKLSASLEGDIFEIALSYELR